MAVLLPLLLFQLLVPDLVEHAEWHLLLCPDLESLQIDWLLLRQLIFLLEFLLEPVGPGTALIDWLCIVREHDLLRL